MNQRTIQQNKALHKGCQEIADVLIENNVTLAEVIDNLEIRPSMETIKALYRDIAKAKYGVTSTTQLETNQITHVWEDLAHAVGLVTGVNIEFPSQESLMFNSLEDTI
jgi:uncharacterized protein YjgD (DUF1641 family)